jgi:hypothetical protein
VNAVMDTSRATGAPTRVSWRERLLAFPLYLTLFPWFPKSRRAASPFLQHHYSQAVSLFVLLAGLCASFVVVILLLSVALVYRRSLYEGAPIEGRILDVLWKLFLCWLVFWVYGACAAVLGSAHPMPVVQRVARRPGLLRVGVLLAAGLQLLALLVTPFAVHASLLARQDARPGTVYMLYEDVDTFPRWLFTLGFYRIALQSRAQFGPGETVVLRLSEETIQRAVSEGKFVFIGSHGGPRGLLLAKKWFKPEDIDRSKVNPELEYVYLTGCDSGTLADAWQKTLAPAEVVTFSRLTAVVEHIWWLWFEGPRVLQTIR